MIETLLTLLALSILGYHAYYVHEVNKEKQGLVDALIARSAAELRDLKLARNTKIKVEPAKQPDLIPLDELDDKAFQEATDNTYGS